MTTTISIEDEIHKLILDKQSELRSNGKRIKISKIVEECIKKSINTILL